MSDERDHKKEEGLCNKIKQSRDLWKVEEEKGIGHSHSVFYGRVGCFSCSGGSDMENKCFHYNVAKE